MWIARERFMAQGKLESNPIMAREHTRQEILEHVKQYIERRCTNAPNAQFQFDYNLVTPEVYNVVYVDASIPVLCGKPKVHLYSIITVKEEVNAVRVQEPITRSEGVIREQRGSANIPSYCLD